MSSKSTLEIRKTSDSFVCELPLRVCAATEKKLLARLEAGRQIYNACLGESLKCLRLLRQSRSYQKARKMPAGVQRTGLYRNTNNQYQFKDSALQRYAIRLRRSWIGMHLDAHTTQKIATRAFKAMQEYALGKRGRPRFKGLNQIHSLEGKSNATGIRWRDNAVKWSGLTIPAIINRKDKVIQHGLSSRVKYVRLVRRRIKGKNRFYAQLICEGRPYQKRPLGTGNVGLDIGPSTVAVAGQKSALWVQFCSQLQGRHGEIRVLQRKLDRQRRANNPDHYNLDGTIKPGPKTWRFSTRYRQTKDQLAEVHRLMAGYRKSLHGQLVNRILPLGSTFLMESLSYRSFQRNFGRSVSHRAPGSFVQLLRRKAESAGGTVIEFPTWNTRLSQTCHCGRVKKKRLSDRVHHCTCGVVMQRDLYSAYLAMHIDPKNNLLHADRAKQAWSSAESLLRTAWRVSQPAIGRASSIPAKGQSGSSALERIAGAKARDVVAACSGSPGKAKVVSLRTPQL